ncbi:MAG TPA: carbohydrate kinase [Balneolaceae bacterium]|nr:carbohydrate kinase [Balneolaceae bacterium]
MNKQKKISCIGEVLWDSLPMGLFLGGAPLNVSFHLGQLGEEVNIISRVGNDRLGKEVLRRIKGKGLPTDLIQQDEVLETGIVEVQLDKQGNPDYNIIEPVAWDKIEVTPEMENVVGESWAIVFGSLALRNNRSRETIYSLLDTDILKVFDINLRAPFYDKQIIQGSLVKADILKLNEDELNQLIDWFSLPKEYRKAVETVAERFALSFVVVTKAADGAILFNNGKWAEHGGFKVDVKDAVGAGDAFLAALLKGIRREKAIDEMLIFANAAGAYVASQSGATPEYAYGDIEELVEGYKFEN